MLLFSQTADRIAATTKKLEKITILADYFKSVLADEATVAAVFFSGRPFPVWEETTLQVGGSLLWRTVAELSGKSERELTEAYHKHGDLGSVAEAVLADEHEPRRGARPPESQQHRPTDIQRIFREISSARGPAPKGFLVRRLLSEVAPLEAKYIVKIMTGDLRIGLKESLVEEAIAKAFGTLLRDVQRANMLLGDIGETLKLAAESRLPEAKMRLFHPIGFMLASPAESAEDALSYFQNGWVEDKYDGIRAQAHCSCDDIRFFSRTRDEITESFPELPDALAGLPHEAILDGEIVAWSYLGADEPDDIGRESSSVARRASSGNATVSNQMDAAPPGASGAITDETAERPSLAQRISAGEADLGEPSPGGTTDRQARAGRALPFSALQQRLGRKKVSEKLMRDLPVAYLVFDVLYANGELLIDCPLRARAKILDALLAQRKSIHHRDTESQRRQAGKPGSQTRFEFTAPFSENREPPVVIALRTTDDARRATVIRAPVSHASSPEELNQLFDAAQAHGNEGLMIKDPESSYTPGRRGKSWLKLKRELATLDVVVTAVEYGHGRRIGVLSDYTFAVRDGESLLNVGKAYSGLTDAEILEMTKWFLDHTIEDQGFRRVVEPKIVLEVAFNNVMKSDRHSSGYALRFPRIVRLRTDKLPDEIDSLDRVKEIYAGQSKK